MDRSKHILVFAFFLCLSCGGKKDNNSDSGVTTTPPATVPDIDTPPPITPLSNQIALDEESKIYFLNNENFHKEQMFELDGVEYNFANLSGLTYVASEEVYYGVIDRTDRYDDTQAQIFKFKIAPILDNENNKYTHHVELIEAIELKDSYGDPLGFLDVEAIEVDQEGHILITSESSNNRTIGQFSYSMVIKFDREGKLIETNSVSETIQNSVKIYNPENISEPGPLLQESLPVRPEEPEYPVYSGEMPAENAPEFLAPEYIEPDNLKPIPEEVYIVTEWSRFEFRLCEMLFDDCILERTLQNKEEIDAAHAFNEELIEQARRDYTLAVAQAGIAHHQAVQEWSEKYSAYLDWQRENIDPLKNNYEVELSVWTNENRRVTQRNIELRSEWNAANNAWRNLERRNYGQRGVNLGLESLALDPSRGFLYAVGEGPMAQDREGIIRIFVDMGETTREFAYQLAHPQAVVSDTVSLGEGKLLILEKRFDSRLGKVFAQIYLVDTTYAASIQDIEAWKADFSSISLKKKLIVDLNDLDELLVYSEADMDQTRGSIQIDNLEGLAIGPELENGYRLMVIASDANRQLRTPQITQFIYLAIKTDLFKDIE